MTINRTCYATPRRVMGWESIRPDTLPVGPSAFGNADGAGSLPTTGAISRHARATENVHYDSEVTAVLQRTRMPSSRDSGTPHVATAVA